MKYLHASSSTSISSLPAKCNIPILIKRLSDKKTWFLKHYLFFDSIWLMTEGYKLHLMAIESLGVSRVIVGLLYYFRVYPSEIILDFTGSHHITGLLTLHNGEILTDMHLRKCSCLTTYTCRKYRFWLTTWSFKNSMFQWQNTNKMYKRIPCYPSLCPDQLGQTHYFCTFG